jgi:glycine/D-amino acid oxidase-like deaminating enzyme
MSRKLDLRTGRPVWFSYRAPRVASSRLTRDVRADVCVVGLGISGAMIADALSADGLSVIGIDRRGPMRGSTPATTALVQFEIDQPLSRLSRAIGRADAERAWRRSRLAVANLGSHVREAGIACDLAERQSLLLAGNVLDRSGLEAEAMARRSAGLRCGFLDRAEIKDRFGIDRVAALLSDGNLALDPRRLTAGLLRAAAARGARYYAPVEATGLDDGPDGVRVATKEGPTIRASTVVLATGYELASIEPPAAHRIISTWAIATRPQRRKRLWPEEAFIWEASDPYLYLRATPDGRVICGGEDEDFADEATRDALIADKSAKIEAKLSKLMPWLDTKPEFAWAGAFGSTSTGLPIIGALPRRPRVVTVMGYGGNGITYSRIAAEYVSSRMAGREDSDADLFAFDR